jgi:hypothetical protein
MYICYALLKTKLVQLPPKPKEFDKTHSTFSGRNSVSGRIPVSFMGAEKFKLGNSACDRID